MAKLDRWLRELQSKDYETRCRAAGRLGKTGDAKAIEALAGIVVSGEPGPLGQAALAALKELGPAIALRPIVRAAIQMSSPQDLFQVGMLEDAVKAFGMAAVAPLTQLLASADPEMRRKAAHLLEALGQPKRLRSALSRRSTSLTLRAMGLRPERRTKAS